jgi:hypothetical protein
MSNPERPQGDGTGPSPLPGFGPTTSICPDCKLALPAEVIFIARLAA